MSSLIPLENAKRLLLQQQVIACIQERERRRAISQLANLIGSLESQQDVMPRVNGRIRRGTTFFSNLTVHEADLRQLRVLSLISQPDLGRGMSRQLGTTLPRHLFERGPGPTRDLPSLLSRHPLDPAPWRLATLPIAAALSNSLQVNVEPNVHARARVSVDGKNLAGTPQKQIPKASQDKEAVEATDNSESIERDHSSRNTASPETPVSCVLHTELPATNKDIRKPSKMDGKWLASLDELKEYKRETGNCIVPRGYPLNPRLASWVAEQRKQYKLMKDGKQASITRERVNLLNEIGFAWNAQEAIWQERLRELSEFQQETGHTLVPLNHAQFPKLGLWIKEQRRHYSLMKQGKPSHMTRERMVALDSIGFCWDTHEAVWHERLGELSEYRSKFGTCSVPTNYQDNPRLGTWVHHQRRQYRMFQEGRASHINAERIEALESIGFIWNPRGKDRSCQGATELDSEEEFCGVDLPPKKRRRT